MLEENNEQKKCIYNKNNNITNFLLTHTIFFFLKNEIKCIAMVISSLRDFSKTTDKP